ncbi:acyl carrier protein [Streptosporangium sp. NBC_01756]|uniref:acyl carrier protein n=1 Tax=Streptosporangium sp. NBC_01756 TaxID=2975950 RepID=UPI002DDB2B64|nr:acyl carrier protein [Streptosporangium sp. NBC_01756]WSC85145.1 acyl carrier protein [Streptosporangium sp. NBC_01756]
MVQSGRPEEDRRDDGAGGAPGRSGQVAGGADRVAAMIEARLGRAVDPDENFFEAGLNSMALVELHAEITGVFGIDIPVTSMFTRPNVRALSRLVEGSQEPGRNDLTRPRPTGGSRRDVRARIRRDGGTSR